MKNKRISLEVLRIIAMCMVVYNHTGENGFELFRGAHGTWLWYVAILLDVISKAGVPLFFMISGALLLGKDESIKDILLKRVLRYIIIIVLFSFIYYLRLYIKNPEYGFSIKFFITYIYSTPFILPYWFLYRYVSFLLVLPVLRAVVRSLREEEYLFLIGIVIFLWFAPVWETVFKLEDIGISTGLGSVFILFPILGYGIANVFSEKLFTSKGKVISLILFAINWGCAVFMNMMEFKETGEYSGTNIDRFEGVSAIVVFYFVIYMLDKKRIPVTKRVENIVCYLGSAAFCTYLFEDMLRCDIFLKMFSFVEGNVQKLLMCIPYMICIIASGVMISTLFRRIPLVNKLKL